jgi:hypothetical protein
MIYLIFISLVYINIEMSSSNQRLDLRTSLQGSSSFLQIESVNPDNFSFDANSQLNLADSIVVDDLTINGTFTNSGGGAISGSSGEYSTSITTPKLIFTDNLAEGLIIESSDGADYIVCNSTNGSEQINLKKKVFTDGNQIVLGTNASRGILQYGNIKNSTIDNTNTLSANTTGTSSAWSSAMTLNLANPYTGGLMNNVSFNGSSTVQLDANYIDESNSNSHRFVLQNTESSHTSVNLQTRIEFLNQYQSGMVNSDNKVVSQIASSGQFSTVVYDNTGHASNASELRLLVDYPDDIPSFNNFVFWDTQRDSERFMKLVNLSTTYDSTTAQKQYPTSIHLGNGGDFSDTVVGNTFAKIQANWVSDGVGQLKMLARKTASSSAQECGLIVTSNAGGNAVNQNQNTANMVIGGQGIDGITNIKYFNGCAIGNSGHLGNGLEYKDSGSSVVSGDTTGYDNTLELKIADSSLETSALGLNVKLKSSGGLETDTGNGLQVQLKTGGGLDVDANGLFVSGSTTNEITDADGSAKITVGTSDQIVVQTNSANRMLINDDGRFSINNQFRMAYTTITAPNQTKVALADIQDYLLLLGGGAQSSGGSIVSYGLGFGAVNVNTDHPPAYIKYDETNIAGDSKGRLVFGARSSTTGTDTLDTMWINNGRVGIGTNDPKGALHVTGGPSGTFQPPSAWGHYFLTGTGLSSSWPGMGGTTNAYPVATGIISESAVMATVYHTFSDERIKTDIEDVPDNLALEQVNNLQCKYYNYKDFTRKREHKVIGFIAQQVADIIPNAVSLRTDFIPDEMRIIEAVWEDNKLIIDLDDVLQGGNYTGNCRFYLSDDVEGKEECMKEVKYENGGFVFDKQYLNVFFWGKEVNDFHTIDKNMIFSLHHSAIQELDKKNNLLMVENNGLLERTQVLEDKNTELENKVNVLETELEDKNIELENKVNSLETLLTELTARVSFNETALKGLIN